MLKGHFKPQCSSTSPSRRCFNAIGFSSKPMCSSSSAKAAASTCGQFISRMGFVTSAYHRATNAPAPSILAPVTSRTKQRNRSGGKHTGNLCEPRIHMNSAVLQRRLGTALTRALMDYTAEPVPGLLAPPVRKATGLPLDITACNSGRNATPAAARPKLEDLTEDFHSKADGEYRVQM